MSHEQAEMTMRLTKRILFFPTDVLIITTLLWSMDLGWVIRKRDGAAVARQRAIIHHDLSRRPAIPAVTTVTVFHPRSGERHKQTCTSQDTPATCDVPTATASSHDNSKPSFVPDGLSVSISENCIIQQIPLVMELPHLDACWTDKKIE